MHTLILWQLSTDLFNIKEKSDSRNIGTRITNHFRGVKTLSSIFRILGTKTLNHQNSVCLTCRSFSSIFFWSSSRHLVKSVWSWSGVEISSHPYVFKVREKVRIHNDGSPITSKVKQNKSKDKVSIDVT